jgi:predicted nucleic acid-binding protein
VNFSTALYDACVLYPAPLRDFLMHLALTNMFRAVWTDEIHEEWIRSVLANRPDLKREKLEQTRACMNRSIRDCLVENYEHLIPNITLPDPDDRHVLAAAIQAHANVIVTYNSKDFPGNVLEPYRIEVQHPDTFISQWISVAPTLVSIAAKRHHQSLKNPPKSAEEYLATLDRMGLTQVVSLLRDYFFQP